ncbi:DNA processing protein DprA [Paenibacillus sp. J31TS4]|uniref:DNA-processing protein DprA n=1 Tax=Paenibacillus sp. J31TS4 TaxID=2807195 RepID=UPI001AFF4C74|nr:DNA-processing protein DprA [Paenibacillus sp. J31TS4]GIP36798.1 DNA processing protein DprA [Paenibacillus sp. J31TS4]
MGMDKRMILLALQETAGIGWKTILWLLERCRSVETLCEELAEEPERFGLPEEKRRLALEGLDEERTAACYEAYAARGVELVAIDDPLYPELLRQTAQPPWLLYAKGRAELLEAPKLAIVGTRTPTSYGRRTSEDLARELADAGLCIVSGLAKGVDGAAHAGGLAGREGTIAVLGTPVEIVYPAENRKLYDRMAEEGLLLSEYAAGTPMHPGLFPQRNRIIAGLSLGTLVVEAALRSGSLITADQALEESRDVFAIPGPISSPKSQGTLSLIKQGAKLVTQADDILEEYRHLLNSPAPAVRSRGRDPEPLSQEEERVLELLSFEPVTTDELLARTESTFGHLHTILLSLLMKKRIQPLAGSAYIRIGND